MNMLFQPKKLPLSLTLLMGDEGELRIMNYEFTFRLGGRGYKKNSHVIE